MKISEFSLEQNDTQVVLMPVGARILSVNAHRGVICLSAIHSQSQKRQEQRRIALYGSGYAIPEKPGTYLGTVELSGGAMVRHAFEVE